jgi:hypothetical protein
LAFGNEKSPHWAGFGYSCAMEWLYALVLKPFVVLVIFGLVCLPVRLLVQRKMRDGKLKRFLLRPISR